MLLNKFSSDSSFVTLATSSASLGVSRVAALKLIPENKVNQDIKISKGRVTRSWINDLS